VKVVCCTRQLVKETELAQSCPSVKSVWRVLVEVCDDQDQQAVQKVPGPGPLLGLAREPVLLSELELVVTQLELRQ
jgi:hypothetical protein